MCLGVWVSFIKLDCWYIMVGESCMCVCVPFRKSFNRVVVRLVGFVICRVSMMGVHGVVCGSMLMGDSVISKGGGVFWIGVGAGGLAASCWAGVLVGAGLLCFLNLFRRRRRSCRNCCRRRYCGVVVGAGSVFL